MFKPMLVCGSVGSGVSFYDTESLESLRLGIMHFPLGPMLVPRQLVRGNREFLPALPCHWNQKLLQSLGVANEFHQVES